MTQIRISTDNAADRATITVANTAAGMGSDKLKTDIKGEVGGVRINNNGLNTGGFSGYA